MHNSYLKEFACVKAKGTINLDGVLLKNGVVFKPIQCSVYNRKSRARDRNPKLRLESHI